MDHITDKERLLLIEQAVAGDKKALETLVLGVQDLVFNLSLRMLGTFPDAEDASQDILVKVITHLSSFRGESSFSTWVFRIAVNHLKKYRKHMFAKLPLSFEFYGDDIRNGKVDDVPDLTQDVEKSVLAEELKMSCTNVMLQCLDVESRCIFILGAMFKVDSRIAGDILGLTPEAYRQRLSRIRKRMAMFLNEYCGECGGGACHCINRVNYAIQNHRISPAHLDFTSAKPISSRKMAEVKEAMEAIDDLSEEFSFYKAYESPEVLKEAIRAFLAGTAFSVVRNAYEVNNMNISSVLSYLTDLSQNNNREWYHAHKAEYKAANAEFEALLQALMLRIGEFDLSILNHDPHTLTFKLNRDTRFSRDKSPYNPAFRAHISSMGKLPVPVGYYMMIKPGNQSFLGGGLFADMFKDATAMVRDYIAANGPEWEQIVHAADFKRHFTVQGTALKNVPAGYDREHPQAQFLKFKSWYLEYPVRDEEMEDAEKFMVRAAEIFRLMKPFNDYLNRALAGFQMPER